MSYQVQAANSGKAENDAAHFIPYGSFVMTKLPDNTVGEKPPTLDSATIARANYEIFNEFFSTHTAELVAERSYSKRIQDGMAIGLKWRPTGVCLTPPSPGVMNGKYVPNAPRLLHVKPMGYTQCEQLWPSSVANGDRLFLQLRFVRVRGSVQLYDLGQGRRVEAYVPNTILAPVHYVPQWVAVHSTTTRLSKAASSFEVEGSFAMLGHSFLIGVVSDNEDFTLRLGAQKRVRMEADEVRDRDGWGTVNAAFGSGGMLGIHLFM